MFAGLNPRLVVGCALLGLAGLLASAPRAFGSTILLVHSNTTGGSTTFTDSSGLSHALTANDNAQHSTAQPHFGATSMSFDGSGDFLSSPASADWDFGGGNFTIDLWVRMTSVSGERTFLSTNSASGWQFGKYNEGGDGLHLYHQNASGQYRSAAFAFTANTWYHVAVSRSSSTVRFFVDGSQIGDDLSANAGGYDSGGGGLLVGRYVGGAGQFAGFMDEIRVSNTALFTSNFTPPTGPEGAAVPEPTGLALLVGLVAVVGRARPRRKLVQS